MINPQGSGRAVGGSRDRWTSRDGQTMSLRPSNGKRSAANLEGAASRLAGYLPQQLHETHPCLRRAGTGTQKSGTHGPVTNGKGIRMSGRQQSDVRDGSLRAHERIRDLARGAETAGRVGIRRGRRYGYLRAPRLFAPAGDRSHLYEVEPLDTRRGWWCIRSLAKEPLPATAGAILAPVLGSARAAFRVFLRDDARSYSCIHETKRFALAAAMDP